MCFDKVDKHPSRPVQLSSHMSVSDSKSLQGSRTGTQAPADKLHGRPLDLIQPGGLGIHLIRRAFSQVDYNLKKEGTELVLEKRFDHTTAK